MLSLDQIRQAKDIQTEEVQVPEWGGSVFVRGLSGTELDAFEQSNVEQRKKGIKLNLSNARARFVTMCCVDEKGNLLFDAFDATWLGTKSAAALDRIYSVAQRLSARTDEDMEELVKNSESIPTDYSVSA